MRRAGRSLFRFWVGLVLVGVLAPPPARCDEGAFKESTDHYVVKTRVSRGFTRLAARHMEAIFDEYRRRLRGFGRDVDRRFEVRVYKTRNAYDGVVPSAIAGSQGAFIPGENKLVACHEGRTNEEVLRTLYHEGFHQFAFETISRKLPVWVNEGLAEYFSEATWNGHGFTTGQVPFARLRVVKRAVRKGNPLALGKLFTMANKDWIRRIQMQQSRAPLQYNQAWSLVHFLVHAQGGRYQGRLVKYLRRLQDGTEPVAAFKKTIGSDLNAMARAWASYVKNLEPTPKFRCRRNMRWLMVLAASAYDSPGRWQSLAGLRKRLLDQIAGGSVKMKRAGKTYRLDGSDVKSLFRCPRDSGGAGFSYVLLRRSGEPMLFCVHHPGILIGAYYEDDGHGHFRVEVEEHVRETLSPELVRALKRKLD